MAFNPQNPLITQYDKTVLLEVQNDLYEEARDALARFAELEKSPEYLHTYRVTPLSLWNAASAGLSAQEMIETLERYSKYDIPANIRVEITEQVSRYGRLRLVRAGVDLALVSEDRALIAEIRRHKLVAPLIKAQEDANTLLVELGQRGKIKQTLVSIGYPPKDEAGYTEGRHLPFDLRQLALSGEQFGLRAYQRDSIQVFH